MVEYKVISTHDTGVPLGKGDSYHARLEDGLNKLGREGWVLQSCPGHLMIFSRPLRDQNDLHSVTTASAEQQNDHLEKIPRKPARAR